MTEKQIVCPSCEDVMNDDVLCKQCGAYISNGIESCDIIDILMTRPPGAISALDQISAACEINHLRNQVSALVDERRTLCEKLETSIRNYTHQLNLVAEWSEYGKSSEQRHRDDLKAISDLHEKLSYLRSGFHALQVENDKLTGERNEYKTAWESTSEKYRNLKCKLKDLFVTC